MNADRQLLPLQIYVSNLISVNGPNTNCFLPQCGQHTHFCVVMIFISFLYMDVAPGWLSLITSVKYQPQSNLTDLDLVRMSHSATPWLRFSCYWSSFVGQSTQYVTDYRSVKFGGTVSGNAFRCRYAFCLQAAEQYRASTFFAVKRFPHTVQVFIQATSCLIRLRSI